MEYWNKHGAPEKWNKWNKWNKLFHCWNKSGISMVCFIEEKQVAEKALA